MEAYTKHISATWPRKRFLSPTLASWYKNHLFLTMRHVWNPDLLSHPKPPERGHHHLADRPLLSASRSRISKIAPTELHLQISITYGVFSWPSAKGAFVFLRKGWNVPHRARETSITHRFYNTRHLPILTFQAGSNELSPSQLSPPLHSHMVIYIQNIFLS